MLYSEGPAPTHSKPWPFQTPGLQAQQARVAQRTQAFERSRADTPLPWPNRNPCRETSSTPQGCFLRHLPQYSMQSKLPHDAIGMLIQISRRLENVELLDRHSAPMHPPLKCTKLRVITHHSPFLSKESYECAQEKSIACGLPPKASQPLRDLHPKVRRRGA